jgi:polyphenol oxidase
MPVQVLFTDRSGGVSPEPFGSLNLAGHVGDDPANVRANRQRLSDRLPTRQLVLLASAPGGPVCVVDASAPEELGDAEALVTTEPALALGVLTADCVPVLLADEAAGVVAAVHSGRRGLAARITPRAVAAAVDAGARVDRLTAWVGPAICGRCYEVGEDVAADVVAVEPAAAARTSWGTTALDLPAAVAAQLRRAGVTDIRTDGRCTLEEPSLYSYRRDGRTGRQASVVVRVPEPAP